MQLCKTHKTRFKKHLKYATIRLTEGKLYTDHIIITHSDGVSLQQKEKEINGYATFFLKMENITYM